VIKEYDEEKEEKKRPRKELGKGEGELGRWRRDGREEEERREEEKKSWRRKKRRGGDSTAIQQLPSAAHRLLCLSGTFAALLPTIRGILPILPILLSIVRV
jgi:hypothetical protein